jgi:hypothetical protein
MALSVFVSLRQNKLWPKKVVQLTEEPHMRCKLTAICLRSETLCEREGARTMYSRIAFVWGLAIVSGVISIVL